MSQIPVISLSAIGLEKNPGFKLSLPLLTRLLVGIVYGDLLQQQVVSGTRPYELHPGSTEELYQHWRKRIKAGMKNRGNPGFQRKCPGHCPMVIPCYESIKNCHEVAIVGEILVKNISLPITASRPSWKRRHLKVNIPDLMDFFLYCCYNQIFKYEELSGKREIDEECQTDY